jgi:hypothetical protein
LCGDDSHQVVDISHLEDSGVEYDVVVFAAAIREDK